MAHSVICPSLWPGEIAFRGGADAMETYVLDGIENEATRERLERLQAIVEVAFDGLAISENGIVVEVTDRLLELSGYVREEVIGHPVIEFVAEEFRALVLQRQREGTEGRFDVVAITKNGRRRVAECITRNHVSDGRTIRLLALRDVTDIRRLEQQSYHAQKMEALGRLASGVAHDFSNLLTVILATSGMLVDALEEPHRSTAREIEKAAVTGASLTRQLLSYSRTESPYPTLVDVNAVVRGTEDMLRRLIGHDIDLITELAESAAVVRMDAAQLQQVFMNLAINARDAMPKGGRLKLVTSNEHFAESLDGAPRARVKSYTVILVSDSGMGMTEAVKDRVFEPFFTTKGPGEGTGLGLALVQRIVEGAGGFITVHSTLGEGTSFAIYLPHA